MEAFVNYADKFPWKSCSMQARYLSNSLDSQRLARKHKPRNLPSMLNMFRL